MHLFFAYRSSIPRGYIGLFSLPTTSLEEFHLNLAKKNDITLTQS